MVKNQDDNFEEELIDELESNAVPPRPVTKPTKPVSRPSTRRQEFQEEQIEEEQPRAQKQVRNITTKYAVFYQPEILAIVDQETNEQVATGFTSQGEAQALCKLLNQSEEIRKNTYVS